MIQLWDVPNEMLCKSFAIKTLSYTENFLESLNIWGVNFYMLLLLLFFLFCFFFFFSIHIRPILHSYRNDSIDFHCTSKWLVSRWVWDRSRSHVLTDISAFLVRKSNSLFFPRGNFRTPWSIYDGVFSR